VTEDTSPDPTGRTLAELADELLDSTGVLRNRELLREIVLSTLALARDDASRLDLKIARSAITEMADAFRVFAPYRDVPKVTIFGSARTEPDHALYALARDLARHLADAGSMVVTGAGPGIMAAGSEGAGRERAIGVNIRLPFETEANAWIERGDKLVEMKYFFTRKLMLMKESSGFLVLPGGFGTLDEAFELLTLIQTGKAEPAPVVLVDLPGNAYWRAWETFVSSQVYARGFADPIDASLYTITDEVDVAIGELLGFHRNYHSRRFIGDTMVLRLHRAPTDAELAVLSVEFADITGPKGLRRVTPFAPERSSNDHLELDRVALEFDRMHHGRLRQLIDALNAFTDGPGEVLPATAMEG
jgi:uncharacterized protein (TIGR00730 family)